MTHTQKPDFVFRRNGRGHLHRRGRQVSRLLAAEVCASAVVMLDTPCSEVVWRVVATHSNSPVSPSLPLRASPCAITYQLQSTKVFSSVTPYNSRSQWQRGLKRRSTASRLMRLWVRIPPEAWFICCECCILSDRGLCDGMITRPEESYRLWFVVECDLETSRMRRPWPALGRSATKKKPYNKSYTNF